ncbi:MAG: cytochrome c biogenesis protein CcsA [Akkermansiaceae bacterium]|nr:cytochrome c biogenesis protein CcsA [Akkermansiaceae bacterium]MCF7730697.1 cytochrome c biogenesis protein CcsA [Akkermansiaceae bacterium]
MKRFIPYLVLVLAAVVVARALRLPSPTDFDLSAFSRLPVLEGGRVKPLDTVARNSLLIIRGKQQVWSPEANPKPPSGFAKVLEWFGFKMPSGTMISADRWLADVLFNEAVADTHPVFAVDNPELLGMLGKPRGDKCYCTFGELKPFLPKIEEQRRLVDESERKRAEEGGSKGNNPFQTAIVKLYSSLVLYEQLKDSVNDGGVTGFSNEIRAVATAKAGLAASREPGATPLPKEQESRLNAATERYRSQGDFARLRLVVPPAGGGIEGWRATGTAVAELTGPDAIPASLAALADMGDAFRAGDAAKFLSTTREYAGWVAIEHPEWNVKSAFELRFNQMEPFYVGMQLYIGAFLLAVGSWLLLPKELHKAAFLLLVVAFVVQTLGMCARMWLQGRPPVTNLYSSALLVGWGAVFIAMFLEWFFRYGIALATAALVGFVTLIIAHFLGVKGDTMEMMVAVLDSNLWLATHVVVITLGYSAMFLAGVLAAAYVVLGLFTRMLNKEAAKTLTGMVYGVICFATLFSFVGTVLGGIWGDQSWGRFWGWDPKENGALLIVIWCAIILHARWGGFIRQRGLMVMAIFGNAITAFSWFGVNMLGVGLHTYGFMASALFWLLAFIIAQVVLILIAQIPLEKWRSFAKARQA